MHKRSTLKCVTYKEGPHVRANGGTKANAPRDLDMGPQIRLPEEDKDERRPGGSGRPPRSAEPGRPPVQVHFDAACPPTPPDHLPYMLLAGTDPEDYKSWLPPPLRHTISYVKEKSREAPPLSILSLGSV